MTTPMLSKSRFIAGLQCPLRLWYQCYNREFASEITPAQQAIFNTGHEVGRLATDLYPGGANIKEDYLHHKEAEFSTGRTLADKTVPALFEAAFSFEGVRIRVDILERCDEDHWNLIEVKSSTSVKDVYKPDLGIQYFVLNGVGLKIARAGILHINNDYVYDGNQLDLNQLFHFSDLTDETIVRQQEIVNQAADLKKVIAAQAAPDIAPSRHCLKPYKCEFWEHCTIDMPEFWVINLSGITQDRFNHLLGLGIDEITDIPNDFPLTVIQERIKNCVINNEEYIAPELKDELLDVEYLVHFLDFETFANAIPRYANTRPYQTIPFQWSDHILLQDDNIQHDEYLCGEDKDPRIEFTESLINVLGEKGSIFIYTSYEKGILRQLIDDFPQFADQLDGIISRFKDLYAITRKHYYNPKFHGSYSLKSVLPALAPKMSYSNLTIQEGSIASLEYLKMHDPSTKPNEKFKIKNNLLKYCEHDTLAMVKIREELLRR
jgi:predicted RecB family nuclease